MKKAVNFFIFLIIAVLICAFITSKDVSVNTGFNMLNKSGMLETITAKEAFLNCFKNGDPYVLSSFYADNILFMSDDGEEIFSGKEMEKALVLFFANHPPKYFLVRHNSRSKGGKSRLLVGRYESSNKETFRITASTIEDEIDMLEICLEHEVIF